MAVGQLFDRAHLAAVSGRSDALALGHAARARKESCPGLVALTSVCAGAQCRLPTQTSSCGSEFILLDGSKCAALACWMVPTILASAARQEWAGVLASSAGCGHAALREGRTHRPCRVARWSHLTKPLQWQLGQHACCLSAAAQNLWVSSGGLVVR